MSSPEHRLDRYLHEALALERTQISTLEAHLAQTPPGTYRRLLERHLLQTRAHALALSSRLDSANGLSGLAVAALGQALALVKLPLGLLRGTTDTRETMLANAKDECASEALEIAAYDAIEALAEAIGDTDTATLARTHRQDEERMLADLRALIPALTAGRTAAAAPPRPAAEDAGQAPWPGYDNEDTPTILIRMTPEDARAVRDYESRHRRRVAILEAAQQALTG